MTILSYQAMSRLLQDWMAAWNAHDLAGVMALLHDEVIFAHWTGGTVCGKEKLYRTWRPWFARHDDFHFTWQEMIIDVPAQKALLRWELAWRPPGDPAAGSWQQRAGVDVLHFQDGLIWRKLTYTKTATQPVD